MEPLPHLHDPEAAILLASVGRAAGRKYSEYLEPTGLRTRHTAAMRALRAGPQSQRELATILDVHATKLVSVLNELEAAGLTIRRRDAADRRRHTVSLSELGRARLAAVDIAKEKVEDVLFHGITHTQRVVLRSLLRRMATNLGLPNSELDQ